LIGSYLFSCPESSYFFVLHFFVKHAVEFVKTIPSRGGMIPWVDGMVSSCAGSTPWAEGMIPSRD
jgi:hypothetical protein